MASDSLQIESIPIVDIRFLSQSDLHALSYCSTTSFDPRRCDDIVIPQIDRSVFNESAGSRKQTYSRLRLAPRKPQSSASSSTTAVPRRISDDTDHERAENYQIIGLLKELFRPKPNGDELVPICVEYSDPEFSNADSKLKKRKRARPLKNETTEDVAAERGDDAIRDIIVSKDIVENRDKDILNEVGSGVDLDALATLEDPYDVELQRRTDNLKSEDEILGFLGELNGKWGTWRRKKKIVDATEFGDVLPKGWKLLVSIRKKQGRVWLFISRYTSPSGRQFVSWKEVSPYLLSLFGLPTANQTICDQSSENIKLSCKMAVGNAADFAVKERNNGGELASYSPSVITHLTNDHDKQLTSEVGNFGENQTGEILECKKCTMTFIEKDDLLHHQLSSHRRRRSRLGTSVTDGVIIKGGQYECQFCHKTFDERHRYNGHVGAHIRHHMKSNEAIPGVVSIESSVAPVPYFGGTPNESTIQTSIGDDDDAMTFSGKTDIVLKSASPQSTQAGSDIESYTEVKVLSGDDHDTNSNHHEGNFGKLCCVRDNIYDEMNDCVGRVDGANDVVAANFCPSLNSEVGKSDNRSNSIGECAADRSNDCPIEQEKILKSCPNSPFVSEKTSGAGISVNGDSSIVEGSKQEAGSESISLVPIHNEKACGGGISVNGDSSIVEGSKQEAGSESISLVPIHNEKAWGIQTAKDVHITGPTESPEPDTAKFDCKLSAYEQTCGVKSDVDYIVSNKMEEPKLDEVQSCGNNELSFGVNNLGLNTQDINLEFGSLLSGNEKTFVEENVTGKRNSADGLPKQKGSFSSGFLNQSYTGEAFDIFYPTGTIEEPKPDEIRNSISSELLHAFGNNGTGIADGMNKGRTEQIFSFESNLSTENGRFDMDPKEGSSLLGSSCYSRTDFDENNMNRVNIGRVWEDPIINEVANSGHDNLTIGFGSSNSQSVGDVIPGFMWRNNEGNILQSTLADTSTQIEQSSGCYPTFTLFSDKGENDLLGVNGKYDLMLGFEGAQSGHIEPVEFSFLTAHNFSSLQGDSKVLSYNTEAGPGFDSSFWLEKDALSLNTASTHLVTSVCIWCTNEFSHDRDEQAGTQTGAIGTVCPTCSARVSQQFNFF